MTPSLRKLIEEFARVTVATVRALSPAARLFYPGERLPQVVILEVLLHEIDRLRDIVAVIERAPTETSLPTAGGPCDAHYRKGRDDTARLLGVEVASVCVRARLGGKDSHETERLVLEAIARHRRAT